MSAERTRAIVLRRTNYGEADRVVQLLTPLGKRNVIARGVRREKSKLAGGIELFAVSDIVINQGKGDLGILTSARLVTFYRHILEDYDRLQFGYEAVRLTAQASETADEPEWYDVLEETLASLDNYSIPRQLAETWFYLRYSALLGYELSCQRDINGIPLEATKTYNYDVIEKGFRETLHGELGADHIKLLRLAAAKPLRTIGQIGGIADILGACQHAVRQHAGV